MRKKIVILLACVLTFGVATAQEKAKNFEASISSGPITFINYPGLSLHEDATECYSKVGGAVTLGYHLNNTMLGVQVQGIHNLATAQLQYGETLQYTTVLLLARHYGRLGEKLEPFAGVKVGVTVMTNSLHYMGNYSESTSCSLMAELELGLNYKCSERSFFGLSVGSSIIASRASNDFELPATLNKNLKADISNYNVMITYGFRF